MQVRINVVIEKAMTTATLSLTSIKIIIWTMAWRERNRNGEIIYLTMTNMRLMATTTVSVYL